MSSVGQPVDRTDDGVRPQAEGWYIYMFKLLGSGLHTPFERVLRQYGFTPAQYTALSVLQARPGITSSELARRSFVRAQSMAETVGVLLEYGLVRREQDPTNAGRLLLFITEAGEESMEQVKQDVHDLQSLLLQGIEPDRLDALADCLRVLRSNMQGLNAKTP